MKFRKDLIPLLGMLFLMVLSALAMSPGAASNSLQNSKNLYPAWNLQILYTGNRATEIAPSADRNNHKELGGLPYESSLMKSAEENNFANLKLDSGNFARLLMNEEAHINTEALIEYFKSVNFDAINATPIDLRAGVNWLQTQASEGNVSLISANMYDRENNKLFFEPYKIVEIEKPNSNEVLRIGIIGITGDPKGVDNEKSLKTSPPVNSKNIKGDPVHDLMNKKENESDWLLNQRSVDHAPLAVYQVANKSIIVAQAADDNDKKSTKMESTKDKSGLESDADPEVEKKLEKNLEEAMTYFEENFDDKVILETGPNSQKKVKDSNKKSKPAQFGASHIMMMPGFTPSESALTLNTMRLTESSYRMTHSSTLTETNYNNIKQAPPVKKSIPNTLDKRQPDNKESEKDKPKGKEIDKAKKSSAIDNPGQFQSVEIDGSDVIFGRKAAKGGGDESSSVNKNIVIEKSIAEKRRIAEKSFNEKRLRIKSPLKALQTYVPELRNEQNCDVIIVLSYFPHQQTAKWLAPQVEGVDFWIAGEWISPMQAPLSINGGWVVASSMFGRHVGIINVPLTVDKEVLPISSKFMAVNKSVYPADPQVQRLVRNHISYASTTQNHRD